jgi:hypothetical protein
MPYERQLGKEARTLERYETRLENPESSGRSHEQKRDPGGSTPFGLL